MNRTQYAIALALLLSIVSQPFSAVAPQVALAASYAQQPTAPTTPAGQKLSRLLKCMNEADATKRLDFLQNGFSDADELEQRVAIANQLNKQFAPLAFQTLVSSEAHRIVVHCSTRTETVLLLDLEVLADEPHVISNIAMRPVESNPTKPLPDGMYPLIRADKTTAPSARGIWEANGYGYVIDITEKSVTSYNVTKTFAWKQDFDDIMFVRPIVDQNGAETKATEPQTSKSTDTLAFTFHPLEPGYKMSRLKALPAACSQKTEWTPTRLFDAYVEIFEVHYPFFDVRNVDWQKRDTSIRPRVNDQMTEADLFDAMQAMIKDLDDGHVSLEATIDGKSRSARTGGVDTLSRLRESFQPTEDIKTYGPYFRQWRTRLYHGIREKTLGGKSQRVANDKIIWGRVDPKIGYVSISGMGGYSLGNTDSQVTALHETLNEVLTKLADTEAMIVDVSFNGGGSDLFSIEIASHFADQRRLGFSKWPRNRKQSRQDRYVTPYSTSHKDGAMYTKPIYLVTNDITASAAEIFTMCMQAMPHVTTIGLPTEGALSDILGKTLPNGWDLGLSNEIYVDHKGVCHEGPGVPPEIKMNIFDPEDITRVGHTEAIEKIAKIILKRIEQ